MKRLTVILAIILSFGTIVRGQDSFLEQLQPRDSILIADQLLYGADLKAVPDGAEIVFPKTGDKLCEYVDILRPWALDTLKFDKKKNVRDLRASMLITTFDEGEYTLPDFSVAVVMPDGKVDTLSFKGKDLFVTTIPVDTATFQVKPLKAQMRYPVTFREILPWIGLLLFVIAAAFAVVYFVKRARQKREEALRRDPPHIVALRKLDQYRENKYWHASKQKVFYSGVTDALREYIASRYGVGAMEMTTAELFRELKKSDIPEELKAELRTLFERSDFVKFAKYIASDEENATVIPLSVRFVTSTYQTEIEGENNVL